jgi:hypothetical protein
VRTLPDGSSFADHDLPPCAPGLWGAALPTLIELAWAKVTAGLRQAAARTRWTARRPLSLPRSTPSPPRSSHRAPLFRSDLSGPRSAQSRTRRSIGPCCHQPGLARGAVPHDRPRPGSNTSKTPKVATALVRLAAQRSRGSGRSGASCG